jgi:hypothetical protein
VLVRGRASTMLLSYSIPNVNTVPTAPPLVGAPTPSLKARTFDELVQIFHIWPGQRYQRRLGFIEQRRAMQVGVAVSAARSPARRTGRWPRKLPIRLAEDRVML